MDGVQGGPYLALGDDTQAGPEVKRRLLGPDTKPGDAGAPQICGWLQVAGRPVQRQGRELRQRLLVHPAAVVHDGQKPVQFLLAQETADVDAAAGIGRIPLARLDRVVNQLGESVMDRREVRAARFRQRVVMRLRRDLDGFHLARSDVTIPEFGIFAKSAANEPERLSDGGPTVGSWNRIHATQRRTVSFSSDGGWSSNSERQVDDRWDRLCVPD